MLRGASADALAELVDALPEPGADGAATLGEQLYGVADVLRGEPALRRLLTDNSVGGDPKAELAERVFGRAVEGQTLAVVQDAVRSRWTSSADLPRVLDHLGTVATVRSAGDGDSTTDELFAVSRLIDTAPGLRDALSDPKRSTADKTGLVRSILDSKVSAPTLRLVERAVAGHQGPVLVALEELQRVAAEARGEVVARAYTAKPMDDDARRRVVEALGRQYGARVHLDEVVEPALIGGLRIEIGDDVIDGTVVSRLDDARRRIAG